MFGSIGWSELIVIALVILIFVGPKQLPSALKKMGNVVGELKRASRELQHQVTEEVRDIERSVGDIQSPKALLRDIVEDMKEDFKEDFKDPYAEIRQSEQSFQEEIRDIQSQIHEAGRPVKEDEKKMGDAASDIRDKDSGKGNPA